MKAKTKKRTRYDGGVSKYRRQGLVKEIKGALRLAVARARKQFGVEIPLVTFLVLPRRKSVENEEAHINATVMHPALTSNILVGVAKILNESVRPLLPGVPLGTITHAEPRGEHRLKGWWPTREVFEAQVNKLADRRGYGQRLPLAPSVRARILADTLELVGEAFVWALSRHQLREEEKARAEKI